MIFLAWVIGLGLLLAYFEYFLDGERNPKRPRQQPPKPDEKGAWPEPPSWGSQVMDALRDRIELDLGEEVARVDQR